MAGRRNLRAGVRRAQRALLVAAVLAVLAATVLAWRALRGRLPGRTAIALPAFCRGSGSAARLRAPRALPAVSRGLPFFCLALADPYTSLSARQVSYPGRRIEVIIDASLSMLSPFSGQQLKTQSDTAFSTSMAAAEYFIRVRMKGRYRDLIALEQFGNEAYIVTPFTTDYDNLLLSLKMISDVNEWQRFPDQGTIIMKAIDEGVDLFNAFDFLDSSGNIMVIFSDGQDNNVQIGDDVARSGPEEGGRQQGAGVHDSHGLRPRPLRRGARPGVEKSHRRDRRQFYPAANQDSILQAIKEIDAAATGRVDVREYSVRQPRYAQFALIAVILWTLAFGMQMSLRMFRTFP